MSLRSRLLGSPSFSVSAGEAMRSGLGALLGLLVTGLVCRLALGAGGAAPALIAPMGASAVLLFAVPASPLAQPRSILGGNLVAALVGVTLARLVPDPILAGALAVGLGIALMMPLRCLHPPSGAVALTAVLGGPAVEGLGYGFVLWPVLVNSALLLAGAFAFNRVVGRSYPHRPPVPAKPAPVPTGRLSISTADLDAVLAEYDEILDIDRADLVAILRGAQLRALERRDGKPPVS